VLVFHVCFSVKLFVILDLARVELFLVREDLIVDDLAQLPVLAYRPIYVYVIQVGPCINREANVRVRVCVCVL
jgi:hypothetical protein